jgi:hypothetical protein
MKTFSDSDFPERVGYGEALKQSSDRTFRLAARWRPSWEPRSIRLQSATAFSTKRNKTRCQARIRGHL